MKIQLFGERHSGTKYIAQLIKNYLGHQPITTYGHKHFFSIKKIKEREDLLEDTLFLCTVRNPYSWIHGMYVKPYHLKMKNKKTLSTFFSQEWTCYNEQGKFIEDDCHIYNRSLFKNIFELRENKIIFLKHTLPKLVPNYMFIRYENFLNENYGQFLIRTISEKFNIPCSLNKNYSKEVFTCYKKGSYPLSNFITNQQTLKEINQKINWNIENDIGYYPIYNIDQPNTDLNIDLKERDKQYSFRAMSELHRAFQFNKRNYGRSRQP